MIHNLLLAFLVALLFLPGCSQPKPSPTKPQSQPLTQSGPKIIDVRSPHEYDADHLAGAINIPYDEIGQRISQVTTNKSEPLLIHCRSGGRSAMAKATLQARGYINVTDLGSIDNARRVTGK
jgi:phage shock protein E